MPHLVAALRGLAALLHTSAMAFQGLRNAGVAYLLFLAVMTLRDRSAAGLPGTGDASGRAAPPSAPPSAWATIRRAVLINLLNPKLTIFFVAFLPQFLHVDGRPDEPAAVGEMLLLSAVFMAVTLAVFAAYGVFAAAMRDHVIGRPRVMTWLRRTFAGSYVLLAGRLAATDR